jgi:hypothetical protein
MQASFSIDLLAAQQKLLFGTSGFLWPVWGRISVVADIEYLLYLLLSKEARFFRRNASARKHAVLGINSRSNSRAQFGLCPELNLLIIKMKIMT